MSASAISDAHGKYTAKLVLHGKQKAIEGNSALPFGNKPKPWKKKGKTLYAHPSYFPFDLAANRTDLKRERSAPLFLVN